MPMMEEVFAQLGLSVLERGWLSSNNIVFSACGAVAATVVDTGYGLHSAQTVSLVRSVLGSVPLERIVNTHLHSDHCGGNAALQKAFGARTWVPELSFDAANAWDEEALTYQQTGQHCDRFDVEGAITAGSLLRLGSATWQVVPAGGHDPDAVMLFEPESRVLITADALWETRLAIIFPEIEDRPGFQQARASLDLIESLEPSVVIPGHGAPFTDVNRALEASRRRLAQFEKSPDRHARYAARALTMFHMLELRHCGRSELLTWLEQTSIFGRLHAGCAAAEVSLAQFAEAVVAQLLTDRLLFVDSTDNIAIA